MIDQDLKIVILQNYYPALVDSLYDNDPSLGKLDYTQQLCRLHSAALSVGDSYAHCLGGLGCNAQAIIINADRLQDRWATEHGLPASDKNNRRPEIVAAQIEEARPDVLLVFEWCPLGDAFLSEIKRHSRLLVGQVASPLPASRTYAAYDLMFSSLPPLVDHFRQMGIAAEPLRLAFDPRILKQLDDKPALAGNQPVKDDQELGYDVTFVGGFAPSHPDREAWLETMLADVEIDIFGYGIDQTQPESLVRSHHRGEVWGRAMFETLRRSRITLNRHARIDVAGVPMADFANNMRLYEATGVGTCLITEERENLSEMFEPGREIVTYRNQSDCLEKIRYFLAHEQERTAIALRGKQRTLRDHSYENRMVELLEILRRHL